MISRVPVTDGLRGNLRLSRRSVVAVGLTVALLAQMTFTQKSDASTVFVEPDRPPGVTSVSNDSWRDTRVDCSQITQTATFYPVMKQNNSWLDIDNLSGCTVNTTAPIRSGNPALYSMSSGHSVAITRTSNGHTLTVVWGDPPPSGPNLSPASRTVTTFVDTAMTPTPALTATGFSSTPTYSISPALPAGLSMNTSNGVISGTSTVVTATQQYTITGTAGDDSATSIVTLTVNPPPTTLHPGLLQVQGSPNFILELDCDVQTGNPVVNIPHVPGGSLVINTKGSCTTWSLGRVDDVVGGTTGANPAFSSTFTVLPNTRIDRGKSPHFVRVNYYVAYRSAQPLRLLPAEQARNTAVGFGVAQTNPVTADGFSSQPTFTISPALPAGLTIDPATGVISGTPTEFQPITTHTITATQGDLTATATVDITVNTYRVGFSGNGTTSNVPGALFVSNDGDSVTLPNGPTRSGFGFNGWFTSTTDSATRVGGPGDSYTPTESLTLYAQWTGPHVVTFDRQGGGTTSTTNVTPGSTLTFPSNPSRTGFTFAGWFDASCQGSQVTAPFTPTGNTTLYAQWNRTISFNRQHNTIGGDASPSNIVVNMNAVTGCTGSSPTLPTITLPSITRPGHRLTGWFSAASGGTKYGDAGATYTVPTTGTSATISMNAQWSTLANVDFDLRGGTITDPRCVPLATPGFCRITWGAGDPAFILPDITSDADLTFDGWFVNATGGTPVGQAGDVLNSPSSRTLRAQWTGTRTYDPNGGTVSIPSVTAKTGVSVGIPLPYRPGYAFDGWIATNPPFGPRNVSRQQTSLTMDKTETWTAQWRQFPNAPALQSASLSEDRRTITLQFSGDLRNLYGTNPSCSDFQVVSDPKDANFDDKATGRTCTIDGSTLTITRNLVDALALSSTSLTVAYVGRSLAAAEDTAAFVHQSAPVEVAMSSAAPTNLVARAGDGQIVVSFDAPDVAGIVNYEYSLNGSTWYAFDPPTTTSPVTITRAGNGPRLQNGREYTVWLRAVTTFPGAASDPVSATPQAQERAPRPVLLPESGALPRLKPGESAPIVGGQRVPVVVNPTVDESSRTGVELIGDGFRINVKAVGKDGTVGTGSARCADGSLPQATDSGATCSNGADAEESQESPYLLLVRGEAAQTTVAGFAPFSAVDLWLLSDPRLLGTFVTGFAGDLEAALSEIPDDISACPHTLQAVGRLANGLPVAASIGVWVTAEPFTDVLVSTTHGAAIGCLESLSVVRGFGLGGYGPNRAVTLRHAAVMLAALGVDEAARPVLDRLYAERDDADGSPAVRDTRRVLTRAEAAELLVYAYGLNDRPDVEIDTANPLWAYQLLVEQEIIRGYGGGRFGADRLVTRAQFASLLVRAEREFATR